MSTKNEDLTAADLRQLKEFGTKFNRKWNKTLLVAFASDPHHKIIQVYRNTAEGQRLVYSHTSIKKKTNKRRGSKLRKSSRPKGKK